MEIQVIEKTNGRINRVTGTTIKKILRVCDYCRVSTDNEEQLNSYQLQLKYYDEKINNKSEWQFAGIYEEENINTGSGQGELVLTLLSAMAQQESENISSHVLLGLKMKKDRGELIGYNGCYGYNYNLETKEITINEEETEIVRYMFERYVEGVGSSTIAKELTTKGIKTSKCGTKWCESTIRGILKNEKYIGDVLMGKTFTIDPISHKRLSNLGEVDKHYIKEHHQPIISKELFDRVEFKK